MQQLTNAGIGGVGANPPVTVLKGALSPEDMATIKSSQFIDKIQVPSTA
jgi:hypothetical protein